MANISCALPPGLEAMTYPIKDNGEDGNDFRRSKDSFFNNESRRLLSSISHDSGYACHNAGEVNSSSLNGLTGAGSLGKVVVILARIVPQNIAPRALAAASDSISDDVVVSLIIRQLLMMPTCNSYKSTCSSSIYAHGKWLYQANSITTATTQDSGYIKPNNLLNWPLDKLSQQQTAHSTTIPNTLAGFAMNASGYVAPQLLQKSLVPAADGFTLEALGKSLKPTETILSQAIINTDDDGGGGSGGGGGRIMSANLPPISGYVTQKNCRPLAATKVQLKIFQLTLYKREILKRRKAIC
ncbi:hypothetical protein EVAR_73033_1 [Eumeta japonica]|uniref:Uncharacterized protein n=1 Tax=Eumeta variegata TaxID=151549 RepID=A0A4C1TM54_EUMVA|nr:hypothetical protein EVAR_73033_1 [Eumeta japonica]